MELGLENLGHSLGLKWSRMGIGIEIGIGLKIKIEIEVYWTGCGDTGLVGNITNFI